MFDWLLDWLGVRKRSGAAPRAAQRLADPLDLTSSPSRMGVTIRVGTLPGLSRRPRRNRIVDPMDYVIAFIVIALVSTGAHFWFQKDTEGPTSASGLPPYGIANPSSPHSSKSKSVKSGKGANLADSAPIPTHIVPAVYTSRAKEAGFHGKVFLIVEVDEQGQPLSIDAAEPIPFGLEAPARQAVFQWRFKPAVLDGRVVEARTIVEVPFHDRERSHEHGDATAAAQ